MSRILVLGLGLIGGSLARALHPAHDVVGVDPDPDTRALARAAGLTAVEAVGDAAADPEIVVVALPLPAVAGALRGLPDAATVTDVASVKSPILIAARAAGLAGRFVGGHPMAGTAGSGFAAGDARLLAGAAWVLALEPDTDLDRWSMVAEIITGLGARVVPATAAEHDAAVARVSHLPHLIAAALVLTAHAAGPLTLGLAAGSFRDATRVAAADPALATAMSALNDTELEEALRAFMSTVGGPDRASLIEAGHRVRAHWPSEPPPAAAWPTGPDLRPRLLELGRRGGWVESVHPGRFAVRDPG